MTETITSIYVLPTEEGMPPRALLSEIDPEHPPTVGDMVPSVIAVFSNDVGRWTLGGLPLPDEVNQAITEHAANLGVPGFEA